MDIVASPTDASQTADTRLPQSIEEKAGLTSSHLVTVEDEAEHPSELNKPPFLKHVSVVVSRLITYILTCVQAPPQHMKVLYAITDECPLPLSKSRYPTSPACSIIPNI